VVCIIIKYIKNSMIQARYRSRYIHIHTIIHTNTCLRIWYVLNKVFECIMLKMIQYILNTYVNTHRIHINTYWYVLNTYQYHRSVLVYVLRHVLWYVFAQISVQNMQYVLDTLKIRA